MKGWLLTTFLLVLAAGGAAGYIIGQRAGDRPQERPHVPWMFPGQDDIAAFITRENVYKELGLEPSQKQVIDYLLGAHAKRVKEAQESLSRLADELRTGINAALTQEQRDRFVGIRRACAERDMEMFVQRDVSYLKDALTLSDSEESSLSAILLDYSRKRWDVLCEKTGRERGECYEELRADRDRQVQALLSPEKFERFRELKNRPRGGFGGRPGPGRGRGPERDPDRDKGHEAREGERSPDRDRPSLPSVPPPATHTSPPER